MAKKTFDAAASSKIDDAFNKAEPWAGEICKQLRQWIHETVPGIVEDWKWGPNFYYHGMCFGIWHFKKHVSFIFHNGAILDDPHHLLIHGKDNLHMRMMKFTPSEKPNEEIVKSYIAAAANANKMGLKSDKKREESEMKPYFLSWLKENKLDAKFALYSAACQREYYHYVEEAKKEETKNRRLEKIKPMLEMQIKLNEKYTK